MTIMTILSVWKAISCICYYSMVVDKSKLNNRTNKLILWQKIQMLNQGMPYDLGCGLDFCSVAYASRKLRELNLKV